MPWKPYHFKDQTVYIRVLPDGKPIVRREMVEMRYRLGATKSYKTTRENLIEMEGELVPDTEMGGSSAPTSESGTQLTFSETPATPADEHTIVIYTDGACSGNPGPAGAGVVVMRPDKQLEISEFAANGTNNYAELTAILRGLEELTPEDADKAVHLYTDSSWSLGVLIGGWKAKTNLKLVDEIKAKLEAFPKVELLKVRAHAGVAGNEEADHLATRAIRREENSRQERPRRRSPS